MRLKRSTTGMHAPSIPWCCESRSNPQRAKKLCKMFFYTSGGMRTAMTLREAHSNRGCLPWPGTALWISCA